MPTLQLQVVARFLSYLVFILLFNPSGGLGGLAGGFLLTRLGRQEPVVDLQAPLGKSVERSAGEEGHPGTDREVIS
jgi:hypothetical protein